MSATFTKLPRGSRLAGALVIALLATLAVGVTSLSAQTSKQKRAEMRRNSPFNLQSGPFAVLNANLVTCGINNEGQVCSDVFDSPTGGGGFWPSGTTNQYIFNSGLQIAGINSAGAGPWAGDTVGAYFFDARGTQEQAAPLSDVFNSLDPNDLANWPAAGLIRDTILFSRQLVPDACLAGDLTQCAKSISDQDSYVEYWDGDPNKISQRAHPMGIKVQQRSLAFNAPAGAENTIFFIYTFSNITNCVGQATEPCNGVDFQHPNEDKFKINLPDAGWTITNVYSAFAMDPDVSSAESGSNYSTAILPFNIGIAYHFNFLPSDFNFAIRSDLYAPPFFPGSGFVGVKYLRSPIDPVTGREVGLTLFTNTTNPSSPNSAFPDPNGVRQLFRYLKGDVNPAAGDPPCPIANAIQRKICAVLQAQTDTRFTEVSGPFDLKAGESQTIVVAYTHGPAVKVPGFTPGVTNQPPGTPLKAPGVGTNPILRIDSMAGLISVPAAAVTITGTDTIIDQTKVNVVPRSILSNALVAQTIFNNKFLLPRPPEPPKFTVVPGNNQVTVIWQPSRSEQTGDPFFAVASQPTINGAPNPLYDPNYRQFDVEGYRIYRSAGLTAPFELVAQFDKTGTTFTDVTCALDPTFVPEEGLPCTPQTYDLNGTIIQYPAGGRVRDAVTGAVIVTKADTVNLANTGVPFVFVDNNVKNGITYRYQVTAFDVNSLKSGPQVLESPKQTQNAVPRSSGLAGTAAQSSVQLRGATKALDTSAPYPTIDAQGKFSGPQPPTNGLTAGDLNLALGQAVQPGLVNVVRIDSVIPYSYGAEFYITTGTGNKTVIDVGEWDVVRSLSSTDTTGTRAADTQVLTEGIVKIPADTTLVSGQFTNAPVFAGSVPFELKVGPPQFNSAEADWAPNALTGSVFFAPTPPGSASAGGSRWFEGANESTADPTLDRLSHGALTGVEIGEFMAYATGIGAVGRRFHQATMTATRAADVQFKWTNGQIASVTDVTHDVPVLFKPTPQASYGFLQDYDGNGRLNYDDVRHLKINDLFGGFQAAPLGDLVAQPVILPTDGKNQDGVADGSGFALYVDGEVFFFVGAPPANATWTLRSYQGVVRKTASGYGFSPVTTRVPAVPGLTLVVNIEQAASLAVNNDLSKVHTVPDPYYVRSQFDLGPSNKGLRFVNLPAQSVVRIYTINGTLVRMLEQNNVVTSAGCPAQTLTAGGCSGGGELQWDLRNRNNQFVASGVYFYVVESPNGTKKTGRLTVVQFAR